MDENTLTTHLGTGLIFAFTEKILWIISLILKISSLLPPGSFGGPDANLKLDIMKLNSHIILIKCIISVFSDTLKIYDKKSSAMHQIIIVEKLTNWKLIVRAILSHLVRIVLSHHFEVPFTKDRCMEGFNGSLTISLHMRFVIWVKLWIILAQKVIPKHTCV